MSMFFGTSRMFVGTSPKDAYMLPRGTHMMMNASQFWRDGRWRSSRPRNAGLIFLDSGGFVFFNRFGDYPFAVPDYLELVRRLRPDYFASMDYPCEPTISSELGKMSVAERIERTVANAVEIKETQQALDIPGLLVPVIQGWAIDDYLHCLDLHQQAGTIAPYMAVGSLCSRSNSKEIKRVIQAVYDAATALGVKQLHGFGIKRSPHVLSRKMRRKLPSRDSAVVYYLSSKHKNVRAGWEKQRNGKTSRFPPDRAGKRLAVSLFGDELTDAALRWRQVQDDVAEAMCCLTDDEIDNGLVAAYEEEMFWDKEEKLHNNN